MASVLGPRKTIEETLQATEVETHRLRRDLTAGDVLVLGIGVIIGAGIFVLVGEGAGLAGPGVVASFAVAAVVCGLAAICYAEFAAMVPAAGSAYTYAYATIGQLVACREGAAITLFGRACGPPHQSSTGRPLRRTDLVAEAAQALGAPTWRPARSHRSRTCVRRWICSSARAWPRIRSITHGRSR